MASCVSPRSLELALTQPTRRASPREAAAGRGGVRYVSFPTPAQMQADSARSGSRSRHSAHNRNASDDEIDADAVVAGSDTPKSGPVDRRGVFCAMLIFVISTPTLIGMGCWPSVVDAVVGGGVTDGARSLSHTISFWLTAILLSAMLAATAYGTRARAQLQSSRIGVYGPLCLMAVAALLVIADPLRRVLQNGGVWTGPSSSAFREGCGEGWKCLTTTGILFMAVFTHTGFAALFTASLWSGNLLALCRDRLCARQSQDTRLAHAAEEFAAANAIREEEERIEEAARIEEVALAHIEMPPKQKVMLASVFPASAKPFANLHVDMQPPPANTFVFSAEDLNGLGSKKTNSAFSLVTSNVTALRRGPRGELLSPPRAATGHSTSVTRAANFAPEGYSYEADSPSIVESVIKVAPLFSSCTGGPSSGGSKPLSAGERAAHHFHPAVPSPTVTSTPSIMSPGAAFAASSPLSSFCNVALTPANGAGGGAANSAASPPSHSVCPPVSAVEKRFQPHQAHHSRRPSPVLV